MIGNSLTEDTGSAQRYHAEDQHEQRNGFTKANHGDILREALACFRQGVRACGAGLARMYSPVAAVTILVMGSTGVTIGQLIKREIVPGIIATIALVVCSFLFII